MAISKITDNSLNITDLTIADDLTVTDDLLLASDSAVIKFGEDADVQAICNAAWTNTVKNNYKTFTEANG